MIEQNTAGRVDPVCLTVIPREIKTGHLADPICGPGVKPRILRLRDFRHLTEHLARTGEIEPAMRHHGLDRRQYIMRAVYIALQGRKLVVKRITYEALCGEMVAFLRLHFLKDLVETGKAFQGRSVKMDLIRKVFDAGEPMVWIL
jgi:hypothetical protein